MLNRWQDIVTKKHFFPRITKKQRTIFLPTTTKLQIYDDVGHGTQWQIFAEHLVEIL
jgi:hypothetical protein